MVVLLKQASHLFVFSPGQIRGVRGMMSIDASQHPLPWFSGLFEPISLAFLRYPMAGVPVLPREGRSPQALHRRELGPYSLRILDSGVLLLRST